MSTGWAQLARESRTAAVELYQHARYRSATSRFYYAAYSAVHDALLAGGTKAPAQGNWGHAELRARLVPNELHALDRQERDKIASKLTQLFFLRVAADYFPTSIVGVEDVKTAHALHNGIESILRRGAR